MNIILLHLAGHAGRDALVEQKVWVISRQKMRRISERVAERNRSAARSEKFERQLPAQNRPVLHRRILFSRPEPVTKCVLWQGCGYLLRLFRDVHTNEGIRAVGRHASRMDAGMRLLCLYAAILGTEGHEP